MTEFEEYDIVRIVRKPDNQLGGGTFVGMMGFVEELDGKIVFEHDGRKYVIFCALKEDGNVDGSGQIPVECVALDFSEEANSRFEKWKTMMNEHVDRLEDHNGMARGTLHRW